MKQRYIWAITLLVVLLLTVAAACVPATAPNPAPATPPTSPRNGGRRGASGTLTKINGDILTLTTSQGSVTVKTIADNTTIQNVTAGTLADLHEGQYVIATGSQDANGNVTATSIMIRPQGQGVPPVPPDRAPRANPTTSPRSGGGWRGAGGTLTKIDGNTLTLTTSQGTVTLLFIADNTTIQNFTTGTLADLHEGQSLNVMGPQDAAGNVTATSIIIQPQGHVALPAPPPGA
ncbi:MAG: DUF5666 domain-containing protein [Chloroflexi bacterium]|nr:DUF5666 domain-containing protein [Chloroflexota bacterium]